MNYGNKFLWLVADKIHVWLTEKNKKRRISLRWIILTEGKEFYRYSFTQYMSDVHLSEYRYIHVCMWLLTGPCFTFVLYMYVCIHRGGGSNLKLKGRNSHVSQTFWGVRMRSISKIIAPLCRCHCHCNSSKIPFNRLLFLSDPGNEQR